MNKKLIFLIAILLVAGAISIFQIQKINTKNKNIVCAQEAKLCSNGSSVGRTRPNCEFASCPPNPLDEALGRQTKFNKLITMGVNDKIIFPDNLYIVLKDINDSRCKSSLQCIWQGELSALFYVNINGSSEEIRLGTVNNKIVNLKNYTFSLESATENNITIIVSVNLEDGDTGNLSGYIHMGPICPVEKYPIDPNCADKPFTNARVDIIIKDSNVLINSVKSDANGNFSIDLSPETYIIKVSSQTGNILPRCQQNEISITTNTVTNLDVSCDTGIR